MQINALTKIEYKGNNQYILEIEKTKKGFTSDQWMTFLQAKTMCRNVKKGSKGVPLLKIAETEKLKNGKIVKSKFPRHFTVFNVDQTEITSDTKLQTI